VHCKKKVQPRQVGQPPGTELASENASSSSINAAANAAAAAGSSTMRTFPYRR